MGFQFVSFPRSASSVQSRPVSDRVAETHDGDRIAFILDVTSSLTQVLAKFFFHGGGCELRQLHTGEPIDWNGPDPLAFGWMSFLHHLEWRLATESGLPELRTFVSEHDLMAVLGLIDELIEGVW